MVTSSRTSSSTTLPVSNSTTSSSPLPSPTAGCSSDALTVFTDETNASEANEFCSSYLEIPAATATVYATSTTYRVTNTTITLTSFSTITEQLPDTTVTDISTEIDFETVTTTTYIPLVTPAKRNAAPGVATTTAIPFASQVATISAPLLSAGCSCIQSRIPISTTTSTLQQQLTLAGPNMTATSTIQQLITTQAQDTITIESVTTTTSTVTTTTTMQAKGTPDLNYAGSACRAFKTCGGTSGCLCVVSTDGPGYCISDQGQYMLWEIGLSDFVVW
ncbi:hypothetical protein KCU67_g334, partial [Aureobasidium melanogenum]